ncbi:MAG: hypothetical protein GY757_18995 [bacterium]|nr:hypothetical protein [bacterium]
MNSINIEIITLIINSIRNYPHREYPVARIENWGCSGCPRHVVVIRHIYRGEDYFVEECDTSADAHHRVKIHNQLIGQLT